MPGYWAGFILSWILRVVLIAGMFMRAKTRNGSFHVNLLTTESEKIIILISSCTGWYGSGINEVLLIAWWSNWKPYGNCGCDALAIIWAIRSPCGLFFPAFSLRIEIYLSSCFLSSSVITLLLLCEVLVKAFKSFATPVNACLLDLTCVAFLWCAKTTFLLSPGKDFAKFN